MFHINNTNGTVSFSGSHSPAPSGSFDIFSVTFQAVGSGTARPSFSADTKVNDNYWNRNDATTKSGATYTIPAPPPSVVPTPNPAPVTPTPTPAPTPAPVNTPAESNDSSASDESPAGDPEQTSEGGLEIKDTTVVSSMTQTIITWSVNHSESISQLVYGESKDNQTTKVETTKKEPGVFESIIPTKKLATPHYFTISATAGDGKIATYSDHFTTKGYPVIITVKESGKVARKAILELNKKTYISDDSGKVTLELAAGTYTPVITTSNKLKSTESFTVKQAAIDPDKGAETQYVAFDIHPPAAQQTTTQTPSFLLIIGASIAISLLAAGAVIGFLIYRRRQVDATSGTSLLLDDPVMSHSYQPTATHYSTVDEVSPPPAYEIEQPSNIPEPPTLDAPPAALPHPEHSPSQQSSPELQPPLQATSPQQPQSAQQQTLQPPPVPDAVLESTGELNVIHRTR